MTESEKALVERRVKKFEEAYGVRVDNSHEAETISTAPVKGVFDNEVVHLGWDDCDGFSYSVILTEEGILHGSVDGDTLTCEDHEGELTQLSLWVKQPLPFGEE